MKMSHYAFQYTNGAKFKKENVLKEDMQLYSYTDYGDKVLTLFGQYLFSGIKINSQVMPIYHKTLQYCTYSYAFKLCYSTFRTSNNISLL